MLETNDKRYLNDLLAKNKLMLDKYEKELSQMPGGSLGMREKCNKGKETLYCHYVDGKRKGISKNDELVYKLARKMFLEKSIKTIGINIKNLQRLTKNYENPDSTSIISGFPYHYAILMDRKEAGWNEEKRIWLSEEYNQSTYKPGEKSHTTSKGLHVRSKSEAIISERLDYYNIPYRYEQMLYIRTYSFAPDFTVLTKNGIKYWEHCGLVNDTDYMGRHNWKMTMYDKAGILPWKNLIVTYDDEHGYLDTRIIDAEIINKLL